MTKKLPRISIITPSYNQGQFVEKTITSVLMQKYPNLEYIVMDGGSTDNTLRILKKYDKKLIWRSEKDTGQSHALNKGLKIATGDIIGYLNSDDYFEQDALFKVAWTFKNNHIYWLTGKCKVVDQKGREVRKLITLYKNLLLKYFCRRDFFYIIQFISQPATFWKKEVVEKVGLFDESLHYDMDYDYWLRIWQDYKPLFIDEYLASYRVHSSSKAVISPRTQFGIEYEIIKRYTDSKTTLFVHKLHDLLALTIYNLFFSKNRNERKIS